MMESEKTTPNIGEKLLKEPIWIGLIVILNLILFFCVSYVIRRKCGNKISDLMSTRKKSTTIEISKDAKTESPSLDNNLLPTLIDSPTISTITRPARPKFSLTTTQDETQLPSSTNTSIPSTPIITHYNSEAAMKLFAAYKTGSQRDPDFSQLNGDRKRLASECRDDFVTCGFKRGTISFSDEEDGPRDRKFSGLSTCTKQLARSKSSDIPSFEEYERKIKRVSTYPARHSPNLASIVGVGNDVHCYPEIRIVNEFNEECGRKPANTGQPINELPDRVVPTSKSLCIEEDVQLSNTLETVDSGYPSTNTVSSNTTQCSALQDGAESRQSNLSASARRKKFGSKAKSNSFYNLSAKKSIGENCDISVHCVGTRESKQDHDNRRIESARKWFRSFDVKSTCSKCNSHYKAMATSFSCENDLERICRYGAVSDSCKKHEYCCQKKQRRQRCHSHNPNHCEGNHVLRHCNSSGSRYFPKYSSPTSRYLSLSEIRDIRRNHKRALARLSSTESEGCVNDSKSCHRRPAYCSKEHYSDGCMSYMANHRHHDRHERSPDWNSYPKDPFKNQMMQSFLKDTYQCAVSDTYAMVTDAETDGQNNHNLLLSPQYSINHSTGSVFKTSIDSSKSVSPIRDTSANHRTRMSNSCSDAIAELTNDTNASSDTGTVLSVMKTKIHASDSVKSIMKDSAYQTKESSMDTFTPNQSIADIIQSIEAITENAPEAKESADSVRRYLQQASLKLALLKRLHGNKQGSKDSAIQTFSEDEMSIEDETRKSYSKRNGVFLAMQMKELKLSQVKEEHSTLSWETDSYNTPNNEIQTEVGDGGGTEKVVENRIINTITEKLNDDSSIIFQETIV